MTPVTMVVMMVAVTVFTSGRDNLLVKMLRFHFVPITLAPATATASAGRRDLRRFVDIVVVVVFGFDHELFWSLLAFLLSTTLRLTAPIRRRRRRSDNGRLLGFESGFHLELMFDDLVAVDFRCNGPAAEELQHGTKCPCRWFWRRWCGFGFCSNPSFFFCFGDCGHLALFRNARPRLKSGDG